MSAKELLKSKHITATKLAKVSGVPEATVRALISGQRSLYKCNLETVKQIADVLELTLEDIYAQWYKEESQHLPTAFPLSHGTPISDKWNMTTKENVSFAKRNLVDSIHKAIRLEGLNVDYADVEAVVHGGLIRGLTQREVTTINNLKHAWHFVLDTLAYPIDLLYIRQINQDVGANLISGCGNIRTADVNIGGTTWTPGVHHYSEIASEISKITESSLSETGKALTLMLYLCRTQPFQDGNKRTSTLAANQLLVKSGHGIIGIPEELDKEFKVKLVTFYETGDMSDAKDFLYKHCIQGYQPRLDLAQPPKPDKSAFYSRREPAPAEEDKEGDADYGDLD